MRLGERRQVLTGQLATLLEHAVQRPDIDYRRIDIVAYSFGRSSPWTRCSRSGVPGAALRAGRHARDDRLPVRRHPRLLAGLLRRSMRAGRRAETLAERLFPLDIFGSSFRDDPEPGEAEVSVGVARERLRWPLRWPKNVLYSDAPDSDGRSIRPIRFTGSSAPTQSTGRAPSRPSPQLLLVDRADGLRGRAIPRGLSRRSERGQSGDLDAARRGVRCLDGRQQSPAGTRRDDRPAGR